MKSVNNIRWILLMVVVILTGCADDAIIDQSGLDNAGLAEGKGYVSFVQRMGNMTRSTSVAQHVGHYEFGVWAFKGDTENEQCAGGDVMDDYLVAYGGNSHYSPLAELAQTYGEDAGGVGATVPGDGISSWFYEGLGSTAGCYKTDGVNSVQPASALQVLKFWDRSQPLYNFFAYAPYFGHQDGETSRVTLTTNSAGQNVLTYHDLSAFYTDPVVGEAGIEVQPSAARLCFAGDYATTPARYNEEVLNANEALYAAQSVSRANYGKDVPLTFRHLNSKIRVAFWEDVPGYKVALIDLVPEMEAAAIHNSTTLTADKNLIPATEAYRGVALSPATKQQASPTNLPESSVVTASTPLPPYCSKATLEATGIRQTAGITSAAPISYADGGPTYNATDNLRFGISQTSRTGSLSNSWGTFATLSEIGGTGASVLNTALYTLPRSNGMSTGYTLHVSYKLIPEDGAVPDNVYDARVWVAPEYCQWQEGKQYTYVFKITTAGNGTTNYLASSDDIFGDGDSNQPYVDPDDPRVPSGAALMPIIFDNVYVTDYEAHNYIDGGYFAYAGISVFPMGTSATTSLTAFDCNGLPATDGVWETRVDYSASGVTVTSEGLVSITATTPAGEYLFDYKVDGTIKATVTICVVASP